jgi:hypothetical protein
MPVNETVRCMLLILPPCTGNVVIACPYYGSEFQCEVIVPAQALLTYMNRVRGKIATDSRESKLWLEASLLWLGVAHIDNDSKAYVPAGMARLFRAFISEMIAEKTATLYCVNCGSHIETWEEQKSNDSFSHVHAIWDETWHCRCGQLIYSHHHDFVFYAS